MSLFALFLHALYPIAVAALVVAVVVVILAVVQTVLDMPPAPQPEYVPRHSSGRS